MRNDGRDATGGGGFAGIDENQELHEVIVDLPAAALDDVHVLLAHGLVNADAVGR